MIAIGGIIVFIYAGCSCAYGQMYQWFSREDKYRDKAQQFSFKALMYDGNLAEAYTAMALGYSSLAWIKHDPDLDSLRGDPEFLELAQER